MAPLFLRVASVIYETTGRGNQQFDNCGELSEHKCVKITFFLAERLLLQNLPPVEECFALKQFPKKNRHKNIGNEFYEKNSVF